MIVYKYERDLRNLTRSKAKLTRDPSMEDGSSRRDEKKQRSENRKREERK